MERSSNAKTESPTHCLRRVVAWYFAHVYGVTEGPGVLPFYCDPRQVGPFAVDAAALAAGEEAALFKLFVGLSMYQARRDVVIMQQQRRMTDATAELLTSPARLRVRAGETACHHLDAAAGFDAGCDVYKFGGQGECTTRPEAPCPVKDATTALRRMGDSGKLPVSAWLHYWRDGGLGALRSHVLRSERDPVRRANLFVAALTHVHRVGRKLATLFVATLSAPSLAPGLTPWFPELDGHGLVVIDTHVARAIDTLRSSAAVRTYEARSRWLVRQATEIDLREYHPEVPRYAPRLVQQALYSFGSKSNRTERGDDCARTGMPCGTCVTNLCPFA